MANGDGAALLDQVAGLAAGQLGVGQGGLHQIMEGVDALPVPRLEVTLGQGEEMQGPCPFGTVKVGGDLHDPLLVQPVSSTGGRPEQVALADQQGHLLLGGGAEVQALDDATGGGY